MMRYVFLFMTFSVLLSGEGYYSDVFMDGGVSLYSHDYFYAADSLGLDWEFMATESNSLQDDLIHGTTDDGNGVLLYPDGQPRFRTIYTNGGSATNHGNSMGETGRQRVRDYFNAGGSYTGSCAGAFITSIHYQTSGTWPSYYHIWPGRTGSTGLIDTPTGHDIEPGCPLLAYYDFGGDMYIDQVYHTGGCYANEAIDWPPETEPLLRFDYPPRATMDGKVSCWAYKADSLTGRLVVIGSHPENYETGERLHLMMAMLQYALDGNGCSRIKGQLENGITREMASTTSDLDPDHTAIGDLQYHHFTVNIPDGSTYLTLDLVGEPGFDLHLFADPDSLAFGTSAIWQDISSGGIKTLTIPDPTPGIWYVAVKCASTVTRSLQPWGYEYTSGTDVLNGVPYTITATWSTASNTAGAAPKPSDTGIRLSPNPFNARLTIKAPIGSRVRIISGTGRTIREFTQSAAVTHWNGTDMNSAQCPSGLYFVTCTTDNINSTQKALLIR